MIRREFLRAGGIVAAAAVVPASTEAVWEPKDWTAVEKANVEVVRRFWAALEAGDAEAHFAVIADDAKLRNAAHTPAAPVTLEARRKTVAGYLKPGAIRVATLQTIAQGPMVIDTRIDRVTSANGATDMYYMGVYFVKDGKIQEWNDYQVAPNRPVKPGDPF